MSAEEAGGDGDGGEGQRQGQGVAARGEQAAGGAGRALEHGQPPVMKARTALRCRSAVRTGARGSASF